MTQTQKYTQELDLYLTKVNCLKSKLDTLKTNRRIFCYMKIHVLEMLLRNAGSKFNQKPDTNTIKKMYQDIENIYFH